jgi:predicted metalloprotease with PDZ domain
MMHKKAVAVFSIILVVALVCSARAARNGGTPHVSIAVDASDAPRKIFHAKLSISAAPGPLTLYYPKWIPGEHGPTGPIVDLAGLKFSANGKEIPWSRIPDNTYAITITVPPGANSVEAQLDYLSPVGGIYSGGASATAKLAMISWNQVLLYPSGYRAQDISFTPSVSIPEGWQFGTSLTVTNQSGNNISFAPVSLETLVDSPVLTGQYFRKIPLQEAAPPVSLDIAADSAAALEITPEQVTHLKNLVNEEYALFGAHHYLHYDFLLTLSDHTAHFGLEHHQSSDDRIWERSLIDPMYRMLTAGLLPHEYTHSWNGKYRRPAGLATPDYQQPMIGDLLWVYEGLTEYIGQIMTGRSGLLTADQYRQELALTAADMDRDRPGREWRNLQDTATDAQDLNESRGRGWISWRRSLDYYPEGELIWLEADTIIRQQSGGRKSLDDFCKLFHGGKDTAPMVVPYTFDDIVNTMNKVLPYDWRKFFTTRLQGHGPGAPLGGIENSGWKVVYDENEGEIERAQERLRHFADFRFSLGFTVSQGSPEGAESGSLGDVTIGSPAYQAGIGPGMVLVAVNGRKYDSDVLHDAVKAAKNSSAPIELLVRNGDYFKTYNVNYHEGEKYPHLVRDTTKLDVLSEIIAAHAK